MHFSLADLTPLAFSVFGVIFAYVSHKWPIVDKKLLKSCTSMAVGKVVHIHKERYRDDDGYHRTRFRPEYVFYDVYRNEERRCISKLGRNPCKIQIGDCTDIFYNPLNDRDFVIADDIRDGTLLQRSFYGLGMFFVVIGIAATVLIIFF